ncbi:MAG: hypothetical protein ACTHM8_10115 [Sphingomonas sp.]
MKLEAPPPRQRVIERGGRLVVIDSGAQTPMRRETTGGPTFRQTAFDGRGILTTRTWYDAKGPRRLAVDPTTGRIARLAPIVAGVALLALAGLLVAFPYALVAIPAFVRPKPWKALKARITGYLDRFAPPAG